MTRTIAIRAFLATSAFGAVAAIAVIAQTGQASAAKSVLNCEGQGSRSVVECCEALVKQNGLPIWMKQTGRNCATVVKCYNGHSTIGAAANSRYCKVALIDFQRGGDGPRDRDRSRGQGRGVK